MSAAVVITFAIAFLAAIFLKVLSDSMGWNWALGSGGNSAPAAQGA